MASNASVAVRTQSPAYQAYQVLHLAFVVAPIIAGADKFFHFLVNWDQYLSPLVTRMLPVSGHTFMLGVGVSDAVSGIVGAVAGGAVFLLVRLYGEDLTRRRRTRRTRF